MCLGITLIQFQFNSIYSTKPDIATILNKHEVISVWDPKEAKLVRGAHEKNGPLDPGNLAKKPFKDLHMLKTWEIKSSHAIICVGGAQNPQNRQITESAGRDQEVHVNES